MPWSSQAVIAETVIVEGASGGVFGYDASGNLRSANVAQTTTDPQQGITCYAGFSTFNGHGAVISLFSSTLDAQLWYADTGTSTQGSLSDSVSSAASTDPFGNAFQSGVTSYLAGTPSTFGTLENALLSFQFAASVFNADVFAPNVAQLLLDSGTTGAGDVPVEIQLQSKNGSRVSPAAAQVTIGKSSTGLAPTTAALLEVQGIAAADAIYVASADVPPGAAPTGVETWHLGSLSNSWTNTVGRVNAQYRIVASPPRTVEIIGGVTAPAGIAGGQTIFTLPVGYRPTDLQSVIAVNVTTGAVVRFAATTAGAINYQSGAASGDTIDFHAFISLDA